MSAGGQMNLPGRLNATRTARYLLEPAAAKRTDDAVLMPVAAAPSVHQSVHRLGVWVTPRLA